MLKHVFADMDLINAQNALDTYGPVVGEENDKFRLTSRLNIQNDVTAYAVDSGVIMVQEVEDPVGLNLVNIIVKPLRIPTLKYPAVKYFIYRGIDKDTLLADDSGATVIKPYVSGDSDLLQNLWDDFADSQQLPGYSSTQNPPLSAIGYTGQPSQDLVDHAFFQDIQDTSLYYVQSGWSLGKFKHSGTTNKPGIEVVTKEVKHFLTFNDVRKLEHILEVAHDPGSPEGQEPINIRSEREKILNYLDPAVAFGTLWHIGVQYKETGSQAPELNGKIIYEDDLYENVIKKFATMNRIYLDIRNHNDQSLNYYQDNIHPDPGKDDNFRLGVNSSPSDTQYYTNYWPIHILNGVSSPQSVIELRTQFFTDNNPDPLVYVDYGFLKNSTTVNQFKFPVKDKNAFLVKESVSGLSGPYELIVPGINSGSNYLPVAFVAKINLIRSQIPDPVMPGSVITNSSYYDNVFGPVNSKVPYLKTGYSTNWKLGLGKRYISYSENSAHGAIVETVMSESGDEVGIFTRVLAVNNGEDGKYLPVKYRDEVSLGMNHTNIDGFFKAIDMFGAIIDANKRPIKSTHEINGETFRIITIPEVEIVSSPTYIKSLVFEKNEFQNQIISAYDNAVSAGDLNPDYHDVYFSLDDYQKISDVEGTFIGRYLVKLAGLDNNGNYSLINTQGSNIFAFTADGLTLVSQEAGNVIIARSYDPGLAYFPVKQPGDLNDLVDFVKHAEETYPNETSYYQYPEDHIKQITTRIRVEYYGVGTGGKYIHPMLNRIAFERAIEGPIYNYNSIVPDQSWKYRLFGPNMNKYRYPVKKPSELLIKQIVHDHLTSNADENLIADNPAPNIIDPNDVMIDWGHVIYGFEALLWGNEVPSFYKGWHIQNNEVNNEEVLLKFIDFAGTIGDIGTGLGETHYHRVNNKPPGKEPYFPDNFDIDRYYEASAPDQDLIGDAEAYGIYMAYLELKNTDPDVSLSQVLEAYYDPNSSLDNNYKNRWKIFCMHPDQDFVEENSGNYIWNPDQQGWADEYEKFKIRMKNMAWGWYNRKESAFPTGMYMYKLWPRALLFEPEFEEQDVDYFIDRYFNYVKNKFENEQSVTLI